MAETQTTATPWSSPRLANVDAIRGLAACLVLFQHVLSMSADTYFPGSAFSSIVNAFCGQWIDLGRVGVIAFFAVSGFVIPFSFKSSNPVRRFISTRFFRLYPAYWLSLIFGLLLAWAAAKPVPLTVALANITMLQTFIGQPDVVGVYWTLSIEMLFYGLCVAVFIVGWLRSTKYLAAAVAGFLGIAIMMAGVHLIAGKDLPIALPMALAVMHLGALVRRAQIDGDPLAKRLLWPVTGIASAVLICVCFMAYPPTPQFHKPSAIAVALSHVVALSIFYFYILRNSPVGRVLPWLGGISYSLYLFHRVILGFLLLALPHSPWWSAVFILLAVVISLGLSALIFKFVEKPAVTLGHRLSGERV